MLHELTPAQLATVYILATAGLGALLYGLIRLAQYIALRGGFADKRLEAVLMPLLHQAIMTVYELETHAFGLINRALEVADKKEIARITYGMLKDVSVGIPGLPFSIQLGKLVSEEKWERFVKSSFDTMQAWTKKATSGLLKGLEPPSLVPNPEFRIPPPEPDVRILPM